MCDISERLGSQVLDEAMQIHGAHGVSQVAVSATLKNTNLYCICKQQVRELKIGEDPSPRWKGFPGIHRKEEESFGAQHDSKLGPVDRQQVQVP